MDSKPGIGSVCSALMKHEQRVPKFDPVTILQGMEISDG
jgi:hypothetical protein